MTRDNLPVIQPEYEVRIAMLDGPPTFFGDVFFLLPGRQTPKLVLGGALQPSVAVVA